MPQLVGDYFRRRQDCSFSFGLGNSFKKRPQHAALVLTVIDFWSIKWIWQRQFEANSYRAG
ncbi:MAG TPA: hypothetical protein VJ323_02110 [Bryobacteraceae bacterium]|jgi:hypothetical protein|nr:hypothetical protein [Bryobacteraceae bacterium]